MMWLLAVLALVGAGFWWLGWSSRRDIARALATLAAMPCKSCGRPYGPEGAHAAREGYFAYYRALAEANPHVRYHMNGVWPVECPACGAKAHFDSTACHLLPPDPIPEMCS